VLHIEGCSWMLSCLFSPRFGLMSNNSTGLQLQHSPAMGPAAMLPKAQGLPAANNLCNSPLLNLQKLAPGRAAGLQCHVPVAKCCQACTCCPVFHYPAGAHQQQPSTWVIPEPCYPLVRACGCAHLCTGWVERPCPQPCSQAPPGTPDHSSHTHLQALLDTPAIVARRWQQVVS
jgi:hypothetical protein